MEVELLGGGRLVQLINRLSSFQTSESFLENKKTLGWVYGDGIIEGKKLDTEVTEEDLKEKKYKTADFLTNKTIFDPSDFDEKGIHKNIFV